MRLILTAFLLTGCATGYVNAPLETEDDRAYRFTDLELADNNSDRLFVVVTLSGGGMPSAAFSYGVLRQLAEVRFGEDQRSLLDEVDVISSVSAGSLPAAYLALHGQQRFLKEFTNDVLDQNISGAYAARMANPFNWLRLPSLNYNRTELLAEAMGGMFDEQTFASVPRKRPFVLIGTMDLALGAQVTFDQDTFDLICTDLDAVPVSFAVASSLAVPPIFSPVELTNYRSSKGDCQFPLPRWVGDTRAPQGSKEAVEVEAWRAYRESGRTLVHLVDGAFSDRLAMRPIERSLRTSNVPWSIRDMADRGKIDKIVLISVDARRPDSQEAFPQQPSFFRATTAASRRASEVFATDISEILRLSLESWAQSGDDSTSLEMSMVDRCNSVAVAACAKDETCEQKVSQACYKNFTSEDLIPHIPDVYTINVRLEDVPEQDRKWARSLPSGLRISKEDRRRLIRSGSELLEEIPAFRQLQRDLQSQVKLQESD